MPRSFFSLLSAAGVVRLLCFSLVHCPSLLPARFYPGSPSSRASISSSLLPPVAGTTEDCGLLHTKHERSSVRSGSTRRSGVPTLRDQRPEMLRSLWASGLPCCLSPPALGVFVPNACRVRQDGSMHAQCTMRQGGAT